MFHFILQCARCEPVYYYTCINVSKNVNFNMTFKTNHHIKFSSKYHFLKDPKCVQYKMVVITLRKRFVLGDIRMPLMEVTHERRHRLSYPFYSTVSVILPSSKRLVVYTYLIITPRLAWSTFKVKVATK